MPKRAKTAANAREFEAFGRRLVALLEASGQPRRGAGSYLAKRYKVTGVTANAWLNGTHRPEPTVAEKIAADHGTTFHELYFGREGRNIASPVGLSLTPEEHALIAKYRSTDANGQSMIDAMVEVVLSQRRQSSQEQGG